MNIQDAIRQHGRICDELYELALEENQFLQEHRQPPGSAHRDRKRAALNRLEAAIKALGSAEQGPRRDPSRQAAIERTQARILQILQIDRENEQLLTRHSLGRTPPQFPAAPARGLLSRAYSNN